MTFGIAHRINLRHWNRDAVLRTEASTSIDSYIKGTKYLELNSSQFVAYNSFNLSSDEGLKRDIQNIEDDTMEMVKNTDVKTCMKTNDMKKHEIGFIAQQVKANTPEKHGVVNDEGEYLTMSYDKMTCISWGALQSLIKRVEYLETKLLKKKKSK